MKTREDSIELRLGELDAIIFGSANNLDPVAVFLNKDFKLCASFLFRVADLESVGFRQVE